VLDISFKLNAYSTVRFRVLTAPVIIEGEEEWEVERILNKRRVRGKDKFLVRWKEFTAESDTWEGRENLENAKEAIKEFEKEYQQDMEDVA